MQILLALMILESSAELEFILMPMVCGNGCMQAIVQNLAQYKGSCYKFSGNIS